MSVPWTESKTAKNVFQIAFWAGLCLYLLSILFIPEISTIFAQMVKISVGALCFYLFDKYVLIGMDTVEEIRNGNIAAAIFVLAYSIAIAAAILST